MTARPATSTARVRRQTGAVTRHRGASPSCGHELGTLHRERHNNHGQRGAWEQHHHALDRKESRRTGQDNRSHVRGHVDAGIRRAVRYRDDIAVAGNEALLLPGFQAPAGALSLPFPSAAQLGPPQVVAPPPLTLRPTEPRRVVGPPNEWPITPRR